MERSISALIDAAVTVENWQEIIAILFARAKRGDLKAIEMLMDRRFGKAIQRNENSDDGTVTILVRHVDR